MPHTGSQRPAWHPCESTCSKDKGHASLAGRARPSTQSSLQKEGQPHRPAWDFEGALYQEFVHLKKNLKKRLFTQQGRRSEVGNSPTSKKRRVQEMSASYRPGNQQVLAQSSGEPLWQQNPS